MSKPLDKLRKEKERLKAELKLGEDKLKARLQYLEKNGTKMALNSMLPFQASHIEKASGIFNNINQAILKILPASMPEEKKQKLASNLKTTEMVVAGIAYRYLTKFLR